MLTNCLAACAHLTITVSETEWDIGRKSSFFIPPPCIRRPRLGGSRRNSATPFSVEKLEWCGYPTVKKIPKVCLFVLAWSTNVTDRWTDRQTPHADIIPSLMHMHRAVKACLPTSLHTTYKAVLWELWTDLNCDGLWNLSGTKPRIWLKWRHFNLTNRAKNCVFSDTKCAVDFVKCAVDFAEVCYVK